MKTDIIIKKIILTGLILASTGSVRAEDNNTTLITNTVNNGGVGYAVGTSGTNNTLFISSGGVLANVTTSLIGVESKANNNAVTVSGTGSVWQNSGSLFVGSYGSGNALSIINGGQVFSAAFSYIGYAIGANSNSVVIAGTGSTWDLGDTAGYACLLIGDNGGIGNRLDVSNGGLLTNVAGVCVGGWEWSGSSDNYLVITNGGKVVLTPSTRADFWIGNNSGASNNWTYIGSTTGTNSLLDLGASTKSLLIGGNMGRTTGNRLTVDNGGVVTNGSIHITCDINAMIITNGGQIFSTAASAIGDWGGNYNTATVTGTGSVWQNSGSLCVGSYGSGNALSIINGGQVFSAANSFIGYAIGANRNSVVIDGTGSTWDLGDTAGYTCLLIGNSGGIGNRLDVSNGGLLTNVAGVCVGGWDVSGSSDNYLAITNGGKVVLTPSTIEDFWIGNNSGANNNWTYIGSTTGTNSLLDLGASTKSLWIGGNNGQTTGNRLTVDNGGVVTNGSIHITYDINAMIITNGGQIFSTAASVIGERGNFNTATVTGTGSVWNNFGALYVGFNGIFSTLSLSDGGAVNVGGDLIIGASSGFGNSLTIASNGALAVTNAAGNGILDVQNGTLTLKGGTVVADQFYVGNGAGSTLAIQLDGVGSGSMLTVGGTAHLEGTLNVTAANGFKPALSNAYTLLTAQTITGAFVATNLPALDDALAWNVTDTSTSIVARVVNGTSPYALWAQAHISDPGQRNSDQNADGDAFSNWQEYIADTDPTNTTSFFSISAISNLPPLRVYFLSSTNRHYTLNWRSNIAQGAWTNVPSQGPRYGTGAADWMEDTNSLSAGFYRIDVRLP